MPSFRNIATIGAGLSFNTTAVTTTYTVSVQDCIVECSASGGAFAVTLPTASGNLGRLYFFKKTDSSANAVTVTPNGSDKIDGAGTYVLSIQWQVVGICSDGTNWVICTVNSGNGTSGYSGPSGYSGYSGPSGYSGYSGPSGYSGYSGGTGSNGTSGFSGVSGYSGPSGYSGFSGLSGYSGYSGKSGYSGVLPTQLVEAYTTLSISSGHVATNASTGNQFIIVANANFQLDNPTSAINGQKIVWRIKQDATGSRLLTLDSQFKLGTTLTSATLSTAANTTDYLAAEYNSDTTHWDVVAFVQGF